MAEGTQRTPRRTNNQPRRSRPEKLLVLMLRMLQDRESKPFMTQNVALYTSHTQHVFRRVYDKLSHALYRSDEVLITVEPKLAARLQATMDRNYEKLYNELIREEARLDALQETEGVTGDVCYTAEREETAVIYSPRAMRFVILMRTLDRVVSKIDLLHISGIIETTHASLAKWTWQTRVTRFANEIIMASNKAVQHTRRTLIEKTHALRQKELERIQAAAERGEEARAHGDAEDKKDMPAQEEIDHAMQHEIEDVEAIEETDDGEIGQLATRGRVRVARLAAAAG